LVSREFPKVKKKKKKKSKQASKQEKKERFFSSNWTVWATGNHILKEYLMAWGNGDKEYRKKI
jgi:hypothetical protein